MSESESMSLQKESQNLQISSQEIQETEYRESHVNSNVNESNAANECDAPSLNGDVQPSKDYEKRRDLRESYTSQFEAFKKMFEEQADLETKLQMAIDFMETSLAQGGTPNFRNFWEARRLCLPMFKENISPGIRSQLWTKYSELSKEARRLKEILDEQSAFAVEQIEIAIQALEEDIAHFEEQLEKGALPEALVFPQALKEHFAIYQNLQRQLNILNTHASRINALRKELLKTDMRVRHKNKFFQRLSAAGDLVFPKRKDLIKQISQHFADDVDQFIKIHFGNQPSNESLFLLREEIKALQGLAKVLTLNTHSFTQTRMRLSECWDRIKTEEKERKKERAQQRVLFKQNSEELEKQIEILRQAIERNEESPNDGLKKVDAIVTQMRNVELGRDELKILRDGIAEIRRIIREQLKAKEDLRQQEENEKNRQKNEKFKLLKGQVERLFLEHENRDADQLMVERDALITEIQDSALTKNEKQELERLIKPLRDIITEKKEKALMALSDDDRQALQQLQNILKQRMERRKEIKNQLEVLRKGAGSSSLDIAKALSFANQINDENERFDKANQAIEEVERRIKELQIKIKTTS